MSPFLSHRKLFSKKQALKVLWQHLSRNMGPEKPFGGLAAGSSWDFSVGRSNLIL